VSGSARSSFWWDGSCTAGWARRPGLRAGQAAGYRPPPGAKGHGRHRRTAPFILKARRPGWLYAPVLKDGPCRRTTSRSSRRWATALPAANVQPGGPHLRGAAERPRHGAHGGVPGGGHHVPADRALPSGPMSRFKQLAQRNCSRDCFVELSPELAAERGIEHGGWLTVRHAARRPGGTCADHPAAQAAGRRLTGSSTRSACRSTGLRR